MKKICLLIFALGFLQYLSAQSEGAEKRWFIGGQFQQDRISRNDQSTPQDKSENNDFRLAAYFGKELSAHWMMGFQLGMNSAVYRSSWVLDNTTNQISIYQSQFITLLPGLFFRYTLNPEQKFQVYTEAFGNTALYSYRYARDNQVDKRKIDSDQFNTGLRLGMNYYVSKKFRVIGSLGGLFYSKISNNNIQGQFSNSNFGANFGLSALAIGLEYRF
jgi:hypothetical protein